MFEEFWDKYPRKVSKKMAQKAFQRLKPTDQVAALQGIDQHLEYWRINGTDKQFIPHPATWINQERWTDEIDLTPPKAEKPQIPWYSTDELTLAKGREVGLAAYAGESMGQYRQRISQHLLRGVAQGVRS